MAACQCAGIDLVRLYMSLGNRLHLERISDDHPRHERRKNPRYRHAITGSLDDHFIGRSQPFPEPFQRRPGHVDPVRMLQYPRLPNHHLPEGPVNIHTNYASHKRLMVYIGLPALSCSRCLCPGWSHHIPRRRVAVGAWAPPSSNSEKGSNEKPSSKGACNTARSPPNINQPDETKYSPILNRHQSQII